MEYINEVFCSVSLGSSPPSAFNALIGILLKQCTLYWKRYHGDSRDEVGSGTPEGGTFLQREMRHQRSSSSRLKFNVPFNLTLQNYNFESERF